MSTKWDYHNEHPEYTLEEWHLEVRNNDTRLGYGEWVDHMIESHVEPKWKPVPAEKVRAVYKCPVCHLEYVIGVEEASVPYCTNEECGNNECETEFERVEVRS